MKSERLYGDIKNKILKNCAEHFGIDYPGNDRIIERHEMYHKNILILENV